MPQSIEALSGSCVLIPCKFQMASGWNWALKKGSSFITGKWVTIKDKRNTIVFDSRNQAASLLKGQITGNLTLKNCTTVLENFPINNNDKYYFRLVIRNTKVNTTFQPAVQINIGRSLPVQMSNVFKHLLFRHHNCTFGESRVS